jgi:uncharacterized protein with HEPN domain
MKKDPLVHIEDIYDSIKAIQKYTLGLSRADFMVSPEKQDAVVRKNIPELEGQIRKILLS